MRSLCQTQFNRYQSSSNIGYCQEAARVGKTAAALGCAGILAVIMLASGCTENPPPTNLVDAAPVDAAPVDAAPMDAAPVDAAPVDAEPVDAEPVDAEPMDAEPVDAAPVDAEPVDAAPVDAEPVDAAPVDAAPVDAAPVDAAPVDAAPIDFAVRGTAAGVLGPVALELRLGESFEVLTVIQDGAFAFQTQLETGASYAVGLVDLDAPCTLRNETGVIADADTAIELTCTGPSLASVVVSGLAPAVTLEPGTTEYVVALPLSQSSVTVTATVATPGDLLAIAGSPVVSGVPSAAIPLSLGDNFVDIVVENHLGWQRTYDLNLRRAGQLAQYAYGKASNTGVEDFFGHSMALSGDTLAVGATGENSAATGVNGNQANDSATDSGAVYVFRRSGTAWQQEAYIKASNTGSFDMFGHGVALSGDTLAVGATGEDSAATGVDGNQSDNSASNSGAVYVFRRSGTTWQQEAYLKASNTGVDDAFGHGVALSGDTLAVGAIGEDSAATGVDGNQSSNSAPNSGAVYVFRRSGETWQQQAYLKASNTGAADVFGYSVTLVGDTLAVGAAGEDSAATGVNGNQASNALPNSGAVYVFRHPDTTWQQEAYLKAANTGYEDEFGFRVMLSDDTLVVGAPFEDSAATGVNGNQSDNSASDSGAGYVFRHSGTAWQQESYLKASNTGANDRFGYSVALASDTLVIGAFLESSAATGVNGNQVDDSAAYSGAAYMFRRSGTTWQQEAYLKASNTGTVDYLGYSVAISGDTVVVGAAFEDGGATGVNGDQASNSVSSSGAVYVFH